MPSLRQYKIMATFQWSDQMQSVWPNQKRFSKTLEKEPDFYLLERETGRVFLSGSTSVSPAVSGPLHSADHSKMV